MQQILMIFFFATSAADFYALFVATILKKVSKSTSIPLEQHLNASVMAGCGILSL